MSIANLLKSLAQVQFELKPLHKDIPNDHFRYKYAGLDQVFEAIKPAFHKHGLVVIQSVKGDFDRPLLETTICHVESSENVSSTTPLYMKNQDPQSFGSAMTYMRRYALMGLIGLTATDEDDDGQSATIERTQGPPPPKVQSHAPRTQAQPAARTQETPVNHAPRPNGISDAQLKRLYAIGKSAKWTSIEIDSWVRSFYGCEPIQLSRQGYDEACGFVSKNSSPTSNPSLQAQINEVMPAFDDDEPLPF